MRGSSYPERSMHLVLIAAAVLFGMSRSVISADKSAEESKEFIRILPVSRTPESDSVQLTIAIPKSGDLVSQNPMWIQFRIDGYALGADSSQFDRATEIAVSDMGQSVHVVIDNEPYFPIDEPAINPFNEEGYYRNTNYKFEVPSSLQEGKHTIRVFPARSFGESLKGQNTLHAISFYLGTADGPSYGGNLSAPYLTYNEPSNQMPLTANQPILLDFLVTNCELTPDGYKVRLSIDGKAHRTLNVWQPYYIYGLPKGKHTIRLELLDRSGNVVPGSFNDVRRTITIH